MYYLWQRITQNTSKLSPQWNVCIQHHCNALATRKPCLSATSSPTGTPSSLTLAIFLQQVTPNTNHAFDTDFSCYCSLRKARIHRAVILTTAMCRHAGGRYTTVRQFLSHAKKTLSKDLLKFCTWKNWCIIVNMS